MTQDPYRLYGMDASPYSAKVRAVLRYRRLPHVWVIGSPATCAEIAHVRPALVPVIRYPDDGSCHTDSTPIIFELERRHPGHRSVLPDDPGQAFLCRLIEDMADEWFPKVLFLYRFRLVVDQGYAATWVVGDLRADLEGTELETAVEAWRERQIDRMPLVGATLANAPILDASFHRLLNILESGVGTGRFLFGSRPSLADFGLFGQLKTMATDPTPMAIIRTEAPKLEHWIRRLEDTSGVEGEWAEPQDPDPMVEALLRLAGSLYLPFLVANASAIETAAEEVVVDFPDGTFTQPPFRYQAKCLALLRQGLADLQGDAAERTRAILQKTECLPALEA